MNNQKLSNLLQATNGSDAVTLSQTNTLISNSVNSYIPTEIKSSDNTSGVVATTNRVDSVGRHVMFGNSPVGGVGNSAFMINTGANDDLVARSNVEGGIIMQDETIQS